MRRALARIGDMKAYLPDRPISGEIDFRVPVMADYACVLPGIVRVGPRTVGFEADDGEGFYRTCLVLVRLAGIPAL